MNSTFIKHAQKDGLRVILVPDKTKDVVTTMVLIGSGSRYESNDVAGISHVLEHMFYKGTKKRPTPAEVAGFIEGIGGEFNAFTSKEYTGFYAKVAANHLADSIDFLSDLLSNPLFREKDLEKEKQVILQEYDMYEDLPSEVASSRFEETLFGRNPLGRDVIGYRESIKSIKRNELIEYKDTHYSSSNVVIVVAGNISALEEKALLKLIEEKFIFTSGAAPKYQKIDLPSQKRLKAINKKTEQTHLVLGFLGPSYFDIDRYPMKLLAMVLGGSMSSRMFLEIREKLGLAYAVRTAAGNYLDMGMIQTYAGVPHEKALKAITAIIKEYREVLKKITDEEYSRSKEIISGRMLIGFEDTNELASHYALSELLQGEIITPKALIGKYRQIKKDDLVSVGNKYFKEQNLALSIVHPNLTEKDIISNFIFNRS